MAKRNRRKEDGEVLEVLPPPSGQYLEVKRMPVRLRCVMRCVNPRNGTPFFFWSFTCPDGKIATFCTTTSGPDYKILLQRLGVSELGAPIRIESLRERELEVSVLIVGLPDGERREILGL